MKGSGMDDSPGNETALALTARVVTAYLSRNPVDAADLPHLIRSVHAALHGLGTSPGTKQAARVEEPLVPAVPIEESVFNDYIVCLEDGKKQKTMKRHLLSAHGLTPEAYRARWGLPANYPMVAPDYAERRSELAKTIGLGTKRIPTS
jgi:predicted transcriptional regulator